MLLSSCIFSTDCSAAIGIASAVAAAAAAAAAVVWPTCSTTCSRMLMLETEPKVPPIRGRTEVYIFPNPYTSLLGWGLIDGV